MDAEGALHFVGMSSSIVAAAACLPRTLVPKETLTDNPLIAATSAHKRDLNLVNQTPRSLVARYHSSVKRHTLKNIILQQSAYSPVPVPLLRIVQVW
jgi:hypothetical protein